MFRLAPAAVVVGYHFRGAQLPSASVLTHLLSSVSCKCVLPDCCAACLQVGSALRLVSYISLYAVRGGNCSVFGGFLRAPCERLFAGEYFWSGAVNAVAKKVPCKLSQSLSGEYLQGNVVLAVADLLHGRAWRAVASEYYRGGTINAVAKKFPRKFSQPLISEYLQGNIVNAVADLLHGRAWRAIASEYYRGETINAVADGSAPHPSVSKIRMSTPSGVPCPSARKWAPLMIRFSSALSLIIAGQAWNGDGSLSGSK